MLDVDSLFVTHVMFVFWQSVAWLFSGLLRSSEQLSK